MSKLMRPTPKSEQLIVDALSFSEKFQSLQTSEKSRLCLLDAHRIRVSVMVSTILGTSPSKVKRLLNWLFFISKI